MNNPVLKVTSLAKTYNRNVVALLNFNLELAQGIVLGLLGPNGAGKSTFINILANIIKRDSGEIYIDAEKITESSYQYKSFCGFVLEKPVYIDKLSISEYLEFAGNMYKLPDEVIKPRMDELIDVFDLQHQKDTWIETCSKGMKKKVSLATALLHDPQLLILDEPFSDLDLIAIGRFKDIINSLKNSGKTILIASHNIQELEHVCDEFAIIQDGKIPVQKNCKDIRREIEKEKVESFENYVYKYIDKKSFEKSLSWLE